MLCGADLIGEEAIESSREESSYGVQEKLFAELQPTVEGSATGQKLMLVAMRVYLLQIAEDHLLEIGHCFLHRIPLRQQGKVQAIGVVTISVPIDETAKDLL